MKRKLTLFLATTAALFLLCLLPPTQFVINSIKNLFVETNQLKQTLFDEDCSRQIALGIASLSLIPENNRPENIGMEWIPEKVRKHIGLNGSLKINQNRVELHFGNDSYSFGWNVDINSHDGKANCVAMAFLPGNSKNMSFIFEDIVPYTNENSHDAKYWGKRQQSWNGKDYNYTLYYLYSSN